MVFGLVLGGLAVVGVGSCLGSVGVSIAHGWPGLLLERKETSVLETLRCADIVRPTLPGIRIEGKAQWAMARAAARWARLS
ncbi:MAG: hypothetical protein KF894_00565 [Labilithrix sp.]|nr:hypothetical protein [Labilithrix sp.]